MFLQVMSIVGALMVLAAYGLNQGGIWRELHAGYLTLNILGSLVLGVVAIVDQRAGFILLEFAWAGLGLIGVARAIRAAVLTLPGTAPSSATRCVAGCRER